MSQVELGTKQEDRGMVNGEASRLMRRLEDRLCSNPEFLRVVGTAWFDKRDLVVFPSRGKTFRVKRFESEDYGKDLKGITSRWLERISEGQGVKTTVRISLVKTPVPSEDSTIGYFRRIERSGEEPEILSLDEEDAIPAVEGLIDTL